MYKYQLLKEVGSEDLQVTDSRLQVFCRKIKLCNPTLCVLTGQPSSGQKVRKKDCPVF